MSTSLWLLDRDEGPASGAGLSVSALLGEDDGRGRRLCCRTCGRTITREGARIAVGGAHEHVKENPAGLVFRIGCFRRAPGCADHGAAVAEHTWFAGYKWQIALCGGCQIHLGWAFVAEADRFHGLILARLRVEEEGRGQA